MTHDEGDDAFTPGSEDDDVAPGHPDDNERSDHSRDHSGDESLATDDELLEDDQAPESDDNQDSDVAGTHSKVTKVRSERSIAAETGEALPFNNNRTIAMAVAAIVLISVVAAIFVSRSAENKDLRLVDGSVEEQLTEDCFWTIVFELENTSDEPLVMLDTSVFTGQGNLAVTQAALDMVVEPGQQVQNGIQYFVRGCPATAAEIDHGSLEITNATLGGRQQTTRLDF